jgi:hypothetical protein
MDYKKPLCTSFSGSAAFWSDVEIDMQQTASEPARKGSSYELTQRPRRTRFDLGQEPPRLSKEQRRLRKRVAELQNKWESIQADLPPQLSRRHSTCVRI